MSTILQELRREKLIFCLEESGGVTGRNMSRCGFEAAEGLEKQSVRSQWWLGLGMEDKRLGGPGNRVSVAQISEGTVYGEHRLGCTSQHSSQDRGGGN